MGTIAVVANILGAVLIVYSQFEMNRIISMWLEGLDVTVGDLVDNSPDIVRISGIDEQWNDELKRYRLLTFVGSLLFFGGYVLLLIDYISGTY